VNHLNCDYAVRITSDCPLLSQAQLFFCMAQTQRHHLDWCTNLPTTDGFDIDVLSYRAWHWLDKEVVDEKDREHVTSYLRTETGRRAFMAAGHSWMDCIDPITVLNLPKISVDTQEDLEFVRKVFKDLQERSRINVPKIAVPKETNK
jgi:spore coat polysaccharide biosynthesis protein SpsF (cytidylyltransferase family)